MEISNQQVVRHLVNFKMIWKNFAFAFAVKQKSIDCFDISIDSFYETLT